MAPSRETEHPFSLLPYLQGGTGATPFRLSLVPADLARRDKAYPFAVLDDTQPISWTLEGAFVTDTGEPLQRVVLQVQKDHYTLPGDALQPVTNLDIDACWQAAFAAGEEGSAPLAAQRGPSGALVPLAPLFFCRTRELFFHPVCPSCGLCLTLCTDDSILGRFGLSPYRGSRDRYLYCASCCGHGLPEFYRYELDHDDPVTVKDRWTLIDRFRQIEPCLDPEGNFPCVGCPEHGACFGPVPQVRARMVPFSFYPFFLLFGAKPSLFSRDFLSLVSGAGAGELALGLDPKRHAGRIALLRALSGGPLLDERLFGPDDERRFLEILYLKLSFLSELRQLVGKTGLVRARLRGEKLWVTLPQGGRGVPSIWNFRVTVAHDPHPVAAGAQTLPSPQDGFGSLALIWLQVLCQNEKIDQGAIHAVVAAVIRNEAGQGAPPPGDQLAQLLLPENIFWREPGFPVRGEWRRFWERAHAPVQLFLDASRGGRGEISETLLFERHEALRQEVRSAIFPHPDFLPERFPAAACRGGDVHPETAPPSPPDPGETVRGILERLVARARLETVPDPGGGRAEPPGRSVPYRGDEDETMETVVLSPGPLYSRGRPLPPIPGTDVCETYLGPTRRGESRQTPASPATEDEAPLLETMLATPRRPGREEPKAKPPCPSPPAPPAPAEADLLAETVFILPPGVRRPRG